MRLDECLAILEAQEGGAGRTLSRLIRPTIIAAPGHTLVWGDWSAIEARVLPWLAGDGYPGAVKVLDIFRANDADPNLPDIYRVEAGNIFGMAPADVPKKGEERQTGKVAVLSLGFGGATGALMAMASNYGIYLDAARAKWIVDTWRANNQWARHFWDDLWAAFTEAIKNPGVIQTAGRVAYVYDPQYHGGTVHCALPCGRTISYPTLRYGTHKTKDKKTGEEIVTEAWTYRKGYGRAALWYGKLAENITQGFAGSIMRHTLKKLDQECGDWMPAVLHTHDEIGTEPEERDAADAAVALREIMEEGFAFTEGLPLVAEVTTNWYYTKTLG